MAAILPASPQVENFSAPMPNSNMVMRGKQYIELMKSQHQLTEDGWNWLKIAADPWHDNVIHNVNGLPDLTPGKSVVFSVVREETIVKPASLGAGNWKFMIANYPWLNAKEIINQTPAASGATIGVVDLLVAPVAYTGPLVGPVIIDYALDSTPNMPNGTFPADGVTDLRESISVPEQNLEGNVRCIGMGIEVVNRTAPLYESGLCSLARMNQPSNQKFHISNRQLGTPNNTFGDREVIPFQLAPQNLADLTLSQDVTQWHAKEGHYSVIPLKIDESHSFAPCANPVLGYRNYPRPGVGAGDWGTNTIVMDRLVPNGTSTYTSNTITHQNPTDTVVAFYTGLTPESTLTLRVRWILERFPSVSEPEILVLARNSARYDPKALELWKHICFHFPPGVMFKENPAGEWFKRILGTIGKFASPLLNAVPVVGPLLSGGASLLSNHLLESAEEDRVERRKENAKKPASQQIAASGRLKNPPKGPKPKPPPKPKKK